MWNRIQAVIRVVLNFNKTRFKIKNRGEKHCPPLRRPTATRFYFVPSQRALPKNASGVSTAFVHWHPWKNTQISNLSTEECQNIQLFYIRPCSNARHLTLNASHENAKLVLEVSLSMLLFTTLIIDTRRHKRERIAYTKLERLLKMPEIDILPSRFVYI